MGHLLGTEHPGDTTSTQSTLNHELFQGSLPSSSSGMTHPGDYSIHSVHSQAPWHPRTQDTARDCSSTVPLQPALHPLSTPEHGLPKQPAPSPIHTALCKGTTNPLQLVPSTFLNFSLGRARFQSGTLGSCSPVTGAAGEQGLGCLGSLAQGEKGHLEGGCTSTSPILHPHLGW